MISKINQRGDRHRRPYHGNIVISWQSQGFTKSQRVQGINVSDSGVQVMCAEPMEVRSIVYLKSPAYESLGNASVRFCRRTGMKYQVGLEFSTAKQLDLQRRQRLFHLNEVHP